MLTEDIAWNPVVSSNIERWRYDPDTHVMEIRFVGSTDTYSYDDVPVDVAQGFESAPSAGKYFHNYIKGKYRFYRG